MVKHFGKLILAATATILGLTACPGPNPNNNAAPPGPVPANLIPANCQAGTPGCDLYLGTINGQLQYDGNLTIDGSKGSQIIRTFTNCRGGFLGFGGRSDCGLSTTSAHLTIAFNPTMNGQPPTALVTLDVGGFSAPGGFYGPAAGSGIPLKGLAVISEASSSRTTLFYRPDIRYDWTIEISSLGVPLFPIDPTQPNRNIQVEARLNGGFLGRGVAYRAQIGFPVGFPPGFPQGFPPGGSFPPGYVPPFTPPTF